MTKYKLRIAKPSDAKEIANLHYSIQEGTPGIFAMMGKPFLKRYYKIVLNDPNKVAICAENEKGQIVGFNNSTLDAKAQMNNHVHFFLDQIFYIGRGPGRILGLESD